MKAYRKMKKKKRNSTIIKSKNKNFINIKTYFNKDAGIDKIVVYYKVSFGKKTLKWFIGYKDAKKFTSMYISHKNDFV